MAKFSYKFNSFLTIVRESITIETFDLFQQKFSLPQKKIIMKTTYIFKIYILNSNLKILSLWIGRNRNQLRFKIIQHGFFKDQPWNTKKARQQQIKREEDEAMVC